MGSQAAQSEEGTTEIEILPSSAHHQLSQISHRSNTPPHPHHHAMSLSNTDSSKPNPQSRRHVGSSESSNSSKAAPSVWSLERTATRTTASPPQSPGTSDKSSCSESIDLGVNPATLTHARIIENPSLEELRTCIEEVKVQFASQTPPLSQYILVTGVSAILFDKLEQEPDLFRGTRATILHSKRQVLYKVMPGIQHEVLYGNFAAWLPLALSQMNLSVLNDDFWYRMAARAGGPVTSKEPDFSFVPGSFDVASEDWPSLVMEVGVAESLPQLRTDAQWWYATSSGQTQLVMLIHTDSGYTDNWSVGIEIWSEVDNREPGMDTRNRPSKVLKRTQHARLENGAVEGASLTLDFETLMRRPPRLHESNVVLTSQTIQMLFRRKTRQ